MNKNLVISVIALAAIIAALVGILMWPVPVVNNNPPQDTADVRNISVKAGDTITPPLTVTGEARGNWFFEASFPIKVIDQDGNVLANSFVQAQGEWMTTDYVPFKGEITFIAKQDGPGFLVFAKDNPSGLPENDKEIRLPVMLKTTETSKINVYFSKGDICENVVAFEREIPKTEAIAAAALKELLKGPSGAEGIGGFSTNINYGVTLKSLKIENTVATADFDETLQAGVAGACKVTAIRAQIEKTLKQFPTVKSVVISINGKSDDILQP